MTECEKIVAKGLLPESFFKPETICDFYVDETLKKVWAIELDLLHEFDRVCRAHNLKYFLIAGSLLGAVRHHGFVPWDDDMDVVMPRNDYEKFLALDFKKEFDEPYFLQTSRTDPGFYYAHAKLRNSNTAAIDYPFIYQGFNLGCFIDILTLENFDPAGGAEMYDEIHHLILENSVAMRLTHPNLSERDKERVKRHSGTDPMAVYNMINDMARKSNETYTGYVSMLSATTYGINRNVFPAECFSQSISCDLYGINTFIPCGYDKILSVAYGDYMEFPPLEKRGVWHSNVVFYPDIPYKEALKNMNLNIK